MNQPGPVRIAGKTLGIIGLGQIGSRVAEIAGQGIRMKILYYDVNRRLDLEERLHITCCPTIEDPRLSAIMSHSCSVKESTRRLMNRERFALMKTAALINASRGDRGCPEALLETLQNKNRRSRAGCIRPRTIAERPPALFLTECDHDSSLRRNVPHSFGSHVFGAKDIVAVLQGEPPRFPV